MFQPVTAELLIQGERAELLGFPEINRVEGTVRFDARAKTLQIIPMVDASGGRTTKPVEFSYEPQDDRLTLLGGDGPVISFSRRRVIERPTAGAQAEFVSAAGINDAGELLVTDLTELRTGRSGASFFEPRERTLKMSQGRILLVKDVGVKEVHVAEARRLLGPSTPVVVTYRHDERPQGEQSDRLWSDIGSPQPDGEAVGRMLERLLKPGTLVFILSAGENAPRP
ncbi:MAG: hypothetical protein QM775_09265 [Pirellulales bacterium]